MTIYMALRFFTRTLLFLYSFFFMTKTELIAAVAADLNVSKKLSAEMLASLIETVIKSVKKGNAVRLQGFGTFNVSKRAARKGVNPRNPKQSITIPAMRVVTFKAGSEFKKSVR